MIDFERFVPYHTNSCDRSDFVYYCPTTPGAEIATMRVDFFEICWYNRLVIRYAYKLECVLQRTLDTDKYPHLIAAD